MRKNNFLTKLRKEEKIDLVEPSEEICKSYLHKSENCLKSAKLLLENNLYENSIGMAYYSMYNCLLALLFRVGIKSENHTGSILILNLLFDKAHLYTLISDAKKERIDKQYYVTEKMTFEPAKELINNAEDFVVELRLIISNLNNSSVDILRENFKFLVN